MRITVFTSAIKVPKMPTCWVHLISSRLAGQRVAGGRSGGLGARSSSGDEEHATALPSARSPLPSPAKPCAAAGCQLEHCLKLWGDFRCGTELECVCGRECVCVCVWCVSVWHISILSKCTMQHTHPRTHTHWAREKERGDMQEKHKQPNAQSTHTHTHAHSEHTHSHIQLVSKRWQPHAIFMLHPAITHTHTRSRTLTHSRTRLHGFSGSRTVVAYAKLLVYSTT